MSSFRLGAAVLAACVSTVVAVRMYSPPPQPAAEPRIRVAEGYGRLPMSFEPNQGQASDDVRYLARGRGYSLLLGDDSAVLRLRGAQGSALGISLVGAAAHPGLSPERPQAGVSHYLIGNDPAGHHRGIPHYGALRYREVYPGIDWVLYGNPQALEYDFVVRPGADPKQIRLDYAGAEALSLNGQGDLVLQLKDGAVIQKKPVVYQDIAGERRSVLGRYRIESNRQVAFELAAYDAGQTLVIDPSLFYSTYLGGSGDDVPLAIAVDGAGSAYVTGGTFSSDFNTLNPIEGDSVDLDVFVTKLSANGSSLVYSTYLGGDGVDVAYGIAVNSAGNAYLAGSTASTDFNVVGGIAGEAHSGADDAFIAKLGTAGSSLVYSTYLGGSLSDGAASIAVDSAGNAYVAGFTASTDFNVVGGIAGEAHNGTDDAFVAKLNAAGNSLVYSTYLGGNDADSATGIAVDGNGNAYVAGNTTSTDFNTVNPIEGDEAAFDCFVARLNPAGDDLIYSTYLGGDGIDIARGLAVDGDGNAYITGFTDSTDFNTLNPADSENGSSREAFVAKLSSTGSLSYSTYLGGTDLEDGRAIAVDGSGSAYVAGETGSTDFPVVAAIEDFNADRDAFITKLHPSGSSLLYSTYLGGDSFESAFGIAVDTADNAYVTGQTDSNNFDTFNSIEGDSAGADGFIAKIGEGSTIHFSTGQYTADENAGTAVIAVQRDAPFGNPVSIQYQVTVGTAGASDFTTKSGTLTWTTGQSAPKLITVTLTDDGLAEPDETINLRLFNAGLAGILGSPADALLTLRDDDRANPAGIAFSFGNYSAGEQGGNAVITVQRTGGTTAPVSVNYATSNDTAIAGTDYSTAIGNLSWGANDTTIRRFTVPLLDDRIAQGDLIVNLALSGPTGALLSSPSSAILTIVDDEAGKPGTLQFGAEQFYVKENASPAALNVTRLGGTAGQACFTASTVAGTAKAAVDYTSTTTGSLCFADGEAGTKSFTVPIINNTTFTGTRSLSLNLGNVAGAFTGTPNVTTLTILEDEAGSPGQIQFSSALFTTGEGGQRAFVTLIRTGGTTGAIGATVTTSNGTAASGSDYSTITTPVSWGSGGATTVTLHIPILEDAAVEGDERLTLTLSSPTGGATLGVPRSAALAIVDNDDTTTSSASTMSFGSKSFVADQGSPEALVTVVRTGSSKGLAEVQLSWPDPARAEPVVETIRFEDGDAESRIVAIPLSHYATQSGDQFVPLSLRNPQGGGLGENPTSTLTIKSGIALSGNPGSTSGGGGALGWWLLLPLAGLGWWRRRSPH